MSEQQYLETRERVIRETAAELGVDVDELREQVDSVLGQPQRAETPWNVIRRTPEPPKRLSWRDTQAWYREHAHEIYKAPNGWTWYVLKSYEKDRKAPYARAFCLVDGFESELGDVYWSEILANARRVR